MTAVDVSRFLSAGQVAKHCQVNRTTVNRWINQGRIKSHTLPGGHFRVRVSDLLVFMSKYEIPVPEELQGSNGEKRGQKRVLIVDDSESARVLINNILEQKIDTSLEIRTANNGIQACLAIGSWKPDLVLLDIRMPGMDGLQVCREIRNSADLEAVRIIVVTAYSEEEGLDKANALGIDSVVKKPVDQDTLVKVVKAVLQQASVYA